MRSKRTGKSPIGISLIAAVLVCTCQAAWSDPAQESDSELVNPIAPPPVERVELPSERPEIEQASYWRKAKPVEPNTEPEESEIEESAEQKGTPPEPIELGQPEWLIPAALDLDEGTEPPEPVGPAVMIGDQQSESIGDHIRLAMANFDKGPPRSTALLLVAREMAVESQTLGDFGDVIEQCHRALDAKPDNQTKQSLAKLGAWAYNRRGEIFVEQGNEHEAFENFQEAVLLDNSCWQALHNRGVTLARYAKHTEALSDFNRVVNLSPEFTVARYNRAEVLSQLERWEDALDDYNVAMKSLGEDANLLASRGHVLAQLGKSKAAVEDFNAALRIDENSSEAYIGRGNTYAKQGLYEQAADDFEQALRIDPRSAPAYRSTAWLMATCPIERYRNGEHAVVAARRLAVLRGTENPMVLDTLAVAYAEAGDFAKAIPYEQQAIVLADEEKDKKAYLERLHKFRQRQAWRD